MRSPVVILARENLSLAILECGESGLRHDASGLIREHGVTLRLLHDPGSGSEIVRVRGVIRMVMRHRQVGDVGW